MPYLTKEETLHIIGFFYTDKTLSYDIQNRDRKYFRSLVKKGLVVITPAANYPGISVAKLVDDWYIKLGVTGKEDFLQKTRGK